MSREEDLKALKVPNKILLCEENMANLGAKTQLVVQLHCYIFLQKVTIG